jgi:glycosyltransferase involved in cell wall biosynthesis
MRILHVVHQYPPDYVGGTELYTQTLARYQVKQGHSVAIVSPSPASGSPSLDPAVEEGVRVYRLPAGPRSPTHVFLSTFRHQAIDGAFQVILQGEQPDIVHLQHLMGLPAGLMRHRFPYLVTLHDYWFFCANAQLLTNYSRQVCDGPRLWINCGRCACARAGGPPWAAPALAPTFAYRTALLKRVLDRARAIIAPTEFVREMHHRLGLPRERVAVIPHGIDVPALPPREEQFASSPLRMAYIGGLTWQKGVHVLIEAVNGLPSDAVRLSIYGDLGAFPDYVTQLKQAARHPGTSFEGRLPRTQLWEVLRRIDVLVAPSLWYETSSLAIQEAFAAGAPVVASNLGVLADRVRDGVDGLLFPPGDAPALRTALLRLIEQPDLLSRLRAAIQPVRTIDQHVLDIEAVYVSALRPAA